MITSDREPTADELRKIKQRKENEPPEHAKILSRQSSALKEGSIVSVVSADSPRRFFIRALSDDDQYEKIGSTLAELYAQETPPTPLDSRVAIYEIVSGGAYALQDSNGTWFRVIARQPPQAGQVLCHFVDVGVCEKFPVAAIRLLPPAVHPVMSTGALAQEVRLDLSEEDALKLNNKFVDLTFETKEHGIQVPCNLTLTKFEKRSDEAVPIVDLLTSDGSSLTELLEKPSGVVRLSTPTKTVSSGTPVSSASSTTTLTCLFDKPATIEPMTVSQMPMSSFPANAIFAAGPTDISLRQLSLDPMPDYMYAKLREECALPESQLEAAPEFGSCYAAFIDERWERVQCIRASKIDKQAFCVYLLDVGAFQYVRKEAMRRLNSTSPFKKMLMFKCKIGGIKPMAGGEVWSRESHEAVREFFEAACGEPVVVEPAQAGWSQWKQLNAPGVPTCEARLSCCGRDIGDWLIACGLALPLDAPVPSPNSSPLITFVSPPPMNIVGGRI